MKKKSRSDNAEIAGTGIIDPEVLEEQLKREERSTRLSMVSLVVMLLLVFVFCLFLMFRYGILTLPDFVSGLFAKKSTGEERIIEVLRQGSDPEGKVETAALDEKALLELLSQSAAEEEYDITVTATFYGYDTDEGSESSVQNEKSSVKAVQKRKDGFTVEQLDESGVVVRRSECSGDSVKVSGLGADGEAVSEEYPLGDEFTFESLAGIPDLRNVRAAAGASAEEGGEYDGRFGTVSGMKIARTENTALYYVRYVYPAGEPGEGEAKAEKELADEYYISLRRGIAVKAQTFSDGRLIWEMSAEAGK